MAGRTDDSGRRPVPRWRYCSRVIETEEYAGDPRIENRAQLRIAKSQATLRQFETDPTLPGALDALNAALVLGEHDRARAAVLFVRKRLRRMPAAISNGVGWLLLDQPTAGATGNLSVSIEHGDPSSQARTLIHQHRKRLIADPRDTLRWVDVGRAYTILGQQEHAERAMRNAIALAPQHRAVLRVYARWLFHNGRPEEAREMLVRNDRTKLDPWLMAAEIAVSGAMNVKAHFARAGKHFVVANERHPGFVTELASAIGEMEFASGNRKLGRKLIRLSLERPTDNSIAQAQFVAQFDSSILVRPNLLTGPTVSEGRYWKATAECRWSSAFDEAMGWYADEPFASRPAVNASFIAVSFLGQAAAAESISRLALQTDPTDQLLLNNLVVALVYQGKYTDAIAQYAKIQPPFQVNYPHFVYLATGGLVAFAQGLREIGLSLYDKAIEIAPTAERGRVAISRLQAEYLVDPAQAERSLPTLEKYWIDQESPMLKSLVQAVLCKRDQVADDVHLRIPQIHK